METNCSFIAPPIVCRDYQEYNQMQTAEIGKHIWVSTQKAVAKLVRRYGQDIEVIAEKMRISVDDLYKKMRNAFAKVWVLRYAKIFRAWHGPELLPEFLGRIK
ncbi:MAG: hypothetical protein WCV41_03405 [Patescibacteria group bacterium]